MRPSVGVSWLAMSLVVALAWGPALAGSEPDRGQPTHALRGLAQLSAQAGVSVVLDEEVDPQRLSIPAKNAPQTVADLNRLLAGSGLVALEISDSLWRIVADPYPTFDLPPYRQTWGWHASDRESRGNVLLDQTTAVVPWVGLEDFTRLTSNFYGDGARLYARAVPRSRWTPGSEDVGVHLIGLPLPDFILDLADIASANTTVSVLRSASSDLSRAVLDYGGGVQVTPLRGADSAFAYLASEHGRGGEIHLRAEDLAGADAYLTAGRRRSQVPWLDAASARGERLSEQVHGGLEHGGSGWSLQLDTFAIQAHSDARFFNSELAGSTGSTIPQWTYGSADVQGTRASMVVDTPLDGELELSLGYLGGESLFETPFGQLNRRLESQLRRHRDGSLRFRRVGSHIDWELALGSADISDRGRQTSLVPLSSVSEFLGTLPAMRATTPYWVGREVAVTRSVEKRFAALAVNGWIGAGQWQVGVRSQTDAPRRHEVSETVVDGPDHCRVDVFWPVYYLPAQTESLPCREMAGLVVEGLNYRQQSSVSRDRRLLVDISVGWPLSATTRLTGRVHNRFRQGAILPSPSPLLPDRSVGAEELRAIELSINQQRARWQQSLTLFANRFRTEDRDLARSLPLTPWQRVVGLEYEGSWQLADAHHLAWSLGYLSARTALEGSAAASFAVGAPAWSGALGYRWELPHNQRLTAQLSFADEARNLALSRLDATPTGFVRLDLSWQRSFGEQVAGVAIHNATDESYATTTFDESGAVGIGVLPAPARTVTAFWQRHW